jgi:hypothetical protein
VLSGRVLGEPISTLRIFKMRLPAARTAHSASLRFCVLVTAATIGFSACGSSGESPSSPTPAPSPLPQPQPVASLSRIDVTGSAVLGGGTLQGSVTLNSEAPPGGTMVTLSSNNDAVTVPATVAVAGGTTQAEFVVSTRTVAADADVTVTGTAGAPQPFERA